jgi:hypothetical protein
LNNLILVVGIALVSFLLASPFFLQTQTAYGKDAYGQGYDDGREDRLDGKRYNDYCSPNRNDDFFCGAYKVGYSVGWNAAGLLYGGQDNSRYYEDEDDDE